MGRSTAASLVMLLVSCGSYNPPSGPTDQWIASIIMNECSRLGVDVVVDFEEHDRTIPGEYYGVEQEQTACMAAYPDTILVYPVCQEIDDIELLRAYARHECCHALLGHVSQLDVGLYQAQEEEAEQCASQ